METTTSIRRLATAESPKQSLGLYEPTFAHFELKSQNRNLNSLLCEIFTYLAVKIQKCEINPFHLPIPTPTTRGLTVGLLTDLSVVGEAK